MVQVWADGLVMQVEVEDLLAALDVREGHRYLGGEGQREGQVRGTATWEEGQREGQVRGTATWVGRAR